jgi:hypothetical protein
MLYAKYSGIVFIHKVVLSYTFRLSLNKAIDPKGGTNFYPRVMICITFVEVQKAILTPKYLGF